MSDIVGRVLKDRYEIIAELGRGGMSIVYLARDKNLGSYWAVKRMKNSLSVDIEAFKREVELLSTLNHSDVPRIVDRIELDDDFFVCMDFIDGVALSKKVANEGPQNEQNVIEWAKLLCDVLYYLHSVKENPIVYRDMKPNNIMLTQSGRVKLIDFGIAKECIRGEKENGTRIGTKGYASPEQYNGWPLDERSDIYSLGVTIYNLVTGKPPEDPPYAVKPIREIDPLLSEGLEYIINKCTQLNPENRYKDCLELKYDLENIETLNSNYKKKMQDRFIKFSFSILCFIISITFVFIGCSGITKERNANYQESYDKGINAEEVKDYKSAADAYREAIHDDPKKTITYEKLFEVLLPKNEDTDHVEKTKLAIDELRKYIDDESNPAHKNVQLIDEVIKQCINIDDPTYASYAYKDYVNIVIKSDEYKNNIINKGEIDSLGIIALNASKKLDSKDMTTLFKAMNDLEKYTTSSKGITPDEKLNNYYILMKLYNSYPDNFKDSYEKISKLGTLAKKIIDANSQSEALKFNNIIPLYELVASSYYVMGVSSDTTTDKRQNFSNSITWFEYLDDLNDNLTENLKLKKGNANKGYFDTYNTPTEISNINGNVLAKLDKASNIYIDILSKNKTSFLAVVNLTEVYFDKEIIKTNPADQNFSKVLEEYDIAEKLKDNTKSLSSFDLAQFSSLKQKLIMAKIKE